MENNAAKIQRAWRNFRNEGIVSLGRKLDGGCFDFMRQQQYDRVDMVEFANPEKISLFQKWLIKIFLRTSAPPDVHLLAKNSRILLCFYVEIFKSKFSAGSRDLVDAASRLVANLFSLMKGRLDGIRSIGVEMSEFIRLFGVWHSSFFQQFIVQLRGDVIYLIYMGVMSNAVGSDVVFSKFRTSVSMYTLMDREAADLKSSPVYMAILMARNSKYCSSNADFSDSKILHEFIIEKSFDYKVPLEKTIPFLLTDHSRAGRLIDSQSLRDDLMCSMLLFTNQGNLMELVAETFQSTRGCNTVEFCSRTMALLLNIISSTSAVSAIHSVWDANKEHSPLETLVLAVRMVRNMSENTFVGIARTSLQTYMDTETFIPTMTAYQILRTDKFNRTCAWITAYMSKCSREEVVALSNSNPFALHEFFNRAMLNLVLDNGSVDLLGDDLLPEFLVYDQERLQNIRLEFSLHSFDDRHLMELINSGRWIGRTTPPPQFFQMAEKFQRILKLGYWVNGDCVSSAVTMRARVDLGSF